MAKNKDSKSFNRTGTFDFETMTIKTEDKNGIYTFDLKAKLKEYDGEEVSFSGATDLVADVVGE